MTLEPTQRPPSSPPHAGLVARLGATLVSRARRYSLAGKNALVTGGTRGLGFAVARVLVEKGAHVAIVAPSASEVVRAIDDLRQSPGGSSARIVGQSCDLRDGQAIVAMVEAVRAKIGPVDVLVNGPGSIEIGPLDAMTFEDFDEAMKLHAFAPLRTMLAVRDGMRARGGGRIANIAAVSGVGAWARGLSHPASRFALVGLSHRMRAELARHGIRVSTIAPGLVGAGSPRRASLMGDHDREYGWFAVADTLPLVSMDLDHAARRVVRAIERGEGHVVMGLPARVAALVEALAPGLVAEAMTLASEFLPQRRGQG